MSGKFDLNEAGIRELMASPETSSAMLSAASVIRGHVRAVAPATRARRFIKSLGVSIGDVVDGTATARVTTDDFKWHWLEYGTVRTPTFRPFMTGVKRSGARWEDNER